MNSDCYVHLHALFFITYNTYLEQKSYKSYNVMQLLCVRFVSPEKSIIFSCSSSLDLSIHSLDLNTCSLERAEAYCIRPCLGGRVLSGWSMVLQIRWSCSMSIYPIGTLSPLSSAASLARPVPPNFSIKCGMQTAELCFSGPQHLKILSCYSDTW